jgi:4-aminobutyrate aminotransferase
MPHKSLDSFFFANSGSEAVEAALKMVRGITRKQNIITMQGSFHGRTYGAMAITKSKTIYADGSAPLMVRPSFLPSYIPRPTWDAHDSQAW